MARGELAIGAHPHRGQVGPDLIGGRGSTICSTIRDPKGQPDAMPCGDRKDAVELAVRVVIDLQGVDAADQSGALAYRRVEQIEDRGSA